MLFLYYVASQEEAVVAYHASNMVLSCHSDALYLSKPGSRSRVGGNFFLSKDATMPANNGAVLNIAQIIKLVKTLAAEAETGEIIINAREFVAQRMRLVEMGHPQPRTPIQMKNSAAHSVFTNNMQPRIKKGIDIQFHWLVCRDAQGQFRYY